MARTEAEKRARAKYKKKCTELRVTLYPTDDDVKQWLEGVAVKSEYVKRLIRDDMAKAGE